MSSSPPGTPTNRPVTLSNVLDAGTSLLRDAGIENPRLDAEVLLRHVLRLDRTQLFLHLPGPASPGVELTYQQVLRRRVAREPVAYILSAREFMGLAIRVSNAVLVPRPETELLVEWALDAIKRHRLSTIADIGTGSGAIALSLAELLPDDLDVRIVATDISPDAIDVARDNLRHVVGAGRRDRVTFRLGNLAAPITERVNLLVANLPYLVPSQLDGNPDLGAEPRVALDGGPDGLDLVRRLVADLPRVVRDHGYAGFELDPDQGDSVVRMLARQRPAAVVRKIFDLAGHSRHVVLEPGPRR